MKNLVLIALICAVGIQANAHHSYCIDVNTVSLGRVNVGAPGACVASKPLALVTDWFNYRGLPDSPYKVEYWQGSFKRSQNVTETFKRTVTDICSGQVLSETPFDRTYTTWLRYSVSNPNLDPEIKESFRLVPLTDKEAQALFQDAENRCKTGGAPDGT